MCAQSFFFVDIFFDGRFSHSLFVVLKLIQHSIVGVVLIEVGRGKKEPQWITELITSGNRSAAGSSVPGKALFFTGAEY